MAEPGTFGVFDMRLIIAIVVVVHSGEVAAQDLRQKPSPSAAYDGHNVHLFYDVSYFSAKAEHQWTQVAIHHTISPDGLTDWEQDADPIVTRLSFAWATMESRSPTALFDGDTIRLWFAGNNRPLDFLPEIRGQYRTK